MARIILILSLIAVVASLPGGLRLMLNEWSLWRQHVKRIGRWLSLVLGLFYLAAPAWALPAFPSAQGGLSRLEAVVGPSLW